jgi:hypothetical protein
MVMMANQDIESQQHAEIDRQFVKRPQLLSVEHEDLGEENREQDRSPESVN